MTSSSCCWILFNFLVHVFFVQHLRESWTWRNEINRLEFNSYNMSHGFIYKIPQEEKNVS